MANFGDLAKQAEAHLQEGEKARWAIGGTYECKRFGSETVRTGVLLATDHRAFFYAKKWTGFETEEIPYSKISSIETGKGMLGRSVTLHTSGNKVSMKWINWGDVDGFVAFVRLRIGKEHTASAISAPASPVVPTDAFEQIRKLAHLRDDGLLSEEEFQVKKRQLLGI